MTESSGSSSSSSSSARILVVEDDRPFAELLEWALKQRGYDVELSSSVTEADDRLGARRFDLVISDVRLPEVSGIELLFKKMAERPPIVLMTAFCSKELRRLATLTGVGLLDKPFSLDNLHAVVSTLLM